MATSDKSCNNNNQCDGLFNIDGKDDNKAYPVLLTFHGSGIQPGNHADSYKVMPPDEIEYLFGLQDHWVLAPSRFGAHNWEAIGELSAKQSLKVLYETILSIPLNLPNVVTESAIAGGHSMV